MIFDFGFLPKFMQRNLKKGQLVAHMPPISSNHLAPITAMCCSNPDSTRLFAADSNGYLAIWSLADFLASFNLNDDIDLSRNSSRINMVVCWRAHSTKIVSLVYSDVSDFVFSASTDESVR